MVQMNKTVEFCFFFFLIQRIFNVFNLTNSDLFVTNVNIFFFFISQKMLLSSAPFWSPVEQQLK